MTIRGCHRFRRIILIIYIYIIYIYIYHTGLYPCFMPNHCTTMRNRKNKAQRYGSCSIGSGGCPMTKRWSATVRCRNAAHTWPTSASRSARRSYLKSTSRTHTDVEFELIGTSPWEHVQHCDLSRFEHFFSSTFSSSLDHHVFTCATNSGIWVSCSPDLQCCKCLLRTLPRHRRRKVRLKLKQHPTD